MERGNDIAVSLGINKPILQDSTQRGRQQQGPLQTSLEMEPGFWQNWTRMSGES